MLVLRGLLAEPADDPDNPFRRVILSADTGRKAREFAAQTGRPKLSACPVALAPDSPPPLRIDMPDPGVTPEETASTLQRRLREYAKRNRTRPRTLLVRGFGIVQASVQEPSCAPERALAGAVALVTGAAGAIGAGICKALLAAGCRVAAADLPGQRLDGLVEKHARPSGNRFIGVPIDVTDRASVAWGLDKIAAAWGGLDIAIVNAGLAHVSSLVDMELEAFRRLEKVNVEGALLTIAETAKRLRLQGTGGDIVVISTKNVFAPGAGFGAYSATKAACHQLARIASLELAPFGIRVNMVAPDAVFADDEGRRSGLWATVGPDRMRARGLDEQGLEDYYKNRNLLKQRVTARHVANAVLFFVSHQTPTTGATIPVDGGLPDATPR